MYSKHQGPTNTSQKEGQGFFESTEIRERPTKKCQVNKEETEDDGETLMFVCPEEGCSNASESFLELELHIDVGVHEVAVRKIETLYDRIRRDWAEKFASIDDYQFKTTKNQPCDAPVSSEETFSPLDIGWVLEKPRKGGGRFSEKVRMYLTAKFDMGERTGRKADPDQHAHNMRNARNERNERLFEREEWLTKIQITGFFSRLVSRQRSRGQDASATSKDAAAQPEEDERQDIEALIRETDRCVLMEDTVVFDTYDLCDFYKSGKIGVFNVAMLKTILHHFEVPFRAKDRKADLIPLVEDVILECWCCK